MIKNFTLAQAYIYSTQDDNKDESLINLKKLHFNRLFIQVIHLCFDVVVVIGCDLLDCTLNGLNGLQVFAMNENTGHQHIAMATA